MSDFLGRLAARVTGQSRTLQPRIAPFFEPPRSPVATHEPLAEMVAQEREPAPSARRPAATALADAGPAAPAARRAAPALDPGDRGGRAPAPNDLLPAESTRRPASAGPPIGAAGGELRESIEIVTAAAPTDARAGARAGAGPQAAGDAPDLRPPAHGARDARGSVPGLSPPPPAPLASASEPRARDRAGSPTIAGGGSRDGGAAGDIEPFWDILVGDARRSVPATPATAPEPQAGTATATATATASRLAAASVAPSLGSPGRAASEPAPAPEPPPPQIHIEIDRIEVRAAPQPALPAAARSRRGPKIGLQEYMRRTGPRERGR